MVQFNGQFIGCTTFSFSPIKNQTTMSVLVLPSSLIKSTTCFSVHNFIVLRPTNIKFVERMLLRFCLDQTSFNVF